MRWNVIARWTVSVSKHNDHVNVVRTPEYCQLGQKLTMCIRRGYSSWPNRMWTHRLWLSIGSVVYRQVGFPSKYIARCRHAWSIRGDFHTAQSHCFLSLYPILLWYKLQALALLQGLTLIDPTGRKWRAPLLGAATIKPTCHTGVVPESWTRLQLMSFSPAPNSIDFLVGVGSVSGVSSIYDMFGALLALGMAARKQDDLRKVWRRRNYYL